MSCLPIMEESHNGASDRELELQQRKRPRSSEEKQKTDSEEKQKTGSEEKQKTSSGEHGPKKALTKKNTAIYVTGLPEDTSTDELVEYFSKYGVIMDDMFTGGPRIKLYDDEAGNFKGDALVVYLREESARMAINLLDDSFFRPDTKICVTQATFDTDQQSEDQPSQGRNRVDKRIWKQHMQQMSKKLAWSTNDQVSPEEEAALAAELRRRAKYARIVVLRGMFTREEALADASFALGLKEDLLEECERLGDITAVHVLVHLEICTVKFREREAASACLRLMNGRYFAGSRLTAELYDGSFSLKESKSATGEVATEDEDEVARLEKFGEWLEADEAEQKEQE